MVSRAQCTCGVQSGWKREEIRYWCCLPFPHRWNTGVFSNLKWIFILPPRPQREVGTRQVPVRAALCLYVRDVKLGRSAALWHVYRGLKLASFESQLLWSGNEVSWYCVIKNWIYLAKTIMKSVWTYFSPHLWKEPEQPLLECFVRILLQVKVNSLDIVLYLK